MEVVFLDCRHVHKRATLRERYIGWMFRAYIWPALCTTTHLRRSILVHPATSSLSLPTSACICHEALPCTDSFYARYIICTRFYAFCVWLFSLKNSHIMLTTWLPIKSSLTIIIFSTLLVNSLHSSWSMNPKRKYIGSGGGDTIESKEGGDTYHQLLRGRRCHRIRTWQQSLQKLTNAEFPITLTSWETRGPHLVKPWSDTLPR